MDETLLEKIDDRLHYYIRNFTLEEVLNEDLSSKTIFLKGKVDIESEKEKNTCILILERPSFSSEDIQKILSTANPKVIIDNYIYRTMNLSDAITTDNVKATMIYPATNKHIEKYRSQEMFMIHESGEDYRNITLPYIMQSAFSLEWVYNILDKKSESECIVYADESFILLPDLKWTSGDTSQLYLIAIVHRRDLKSIRDLDRSHVTLLEKILLKSREAIKSIYNVPFSQLRTYIHYQPSYYHLHVHFANLKLENFGCAAGKALLLEDVIDNIKMNSDYYKKKTLAFFVRQNDPLFEKFKVAGKV